MRLHPDAAWAAVTASPVFGVVLTLAAYVLARRLWERAGHHPWVNPVLISIAVVGLVLWATGVDYDTYQRGGSLIALLLGPATVALAWPMHKELHLVRRAAVPILVGVVVGTGVAVTVAVTVTSGLGADDALARSMATTSTTTPVSIALSGTIGGIPALSAVLTILAGIAGAVVGPQLLSLLRFRDARVRGLAVGVSSHGIGAGRMLHESRTEGAFAGLAMALSALTMSVWVPVLVPVLT
jgi:predicted murein hydrolase (TIGR00659 family)